MERTGDLAADLAVVAEDLVRWLRASPTPEPLSPGAASVLIRLHFAGSMRIADLTRTQNITQPAVTQLVDRLEADGLVSRVRSTEDRRVTVVHITDDGRREVEERRKRRAVRINEHLAMLTAAQREAITKAIPAVDALIESVPPGAGES